MFGFGNQSVITDEKKVDELLSRGVSEVITKDELRAKLLSGKQLRVKLGIDPTSPNLHLGRSIPLLKLRDFQELGHRVVLIVGDFTGVIGDTSDKESERPMLTETAVALNMRNYTEQAGKILDINKAEIRRNSEWLSKLTYAEIGKHADAFSVADFIARENIKKRLDAGTRVSLREVLYPLMQGYDSVAVNADVELGGTDQRFNLLAGRVLQEKSGQIPQNILMTDLIEGLDGRKMSSSWGNTINFTDSPEDMYGKVMRLNDSLIEKYFIHVTRVPREEVAEALAGEPMQAKHTLAHAIVSLYYTEKEADSAKEQFKKAFSDGGVPENIPEIARDKTLSETLLKGNVIASKKEFERLISDGAITNTETGEKISDIQAQALPGVYKVGKRRFVKIIS
ncbi:tyrosine--tRNA ligase [Candidatus Kaiserbacteria bacterium CG10_big_fil_rev_8_21_14_0_10_49_17]|uniref:Tyrosine--tRNA ligase n=1 Tax=Candidatus Kaiserbacteria bacterium CG10_big_fil_rev_8_21_14_0_10_49_17 TaxID=1974609 RepID=A0A2M6WDH4_9BACT|nr:MAG: tyrosine--tRNA ligase [Candidatus Kaiserbacteria bacterium CG10_big_fil_rev_8_21_14_0_10_49_17]